MPSFILRDHCRAWRFGAWKCSAGIAVLVLSFMFAFPLVARADETVKIVADPTHKPPRVEVLGLPPAVLKQLAQAQLDADDWRRLFRVSLVPDGDETPPAMLGDYAIDRENNKLVFEPRFPWQPGVKYQAAWTPAGLSKIVVPGSNLSRAFSLPKPAPAAPTEVVDVFPTRNVLPENQLKFYIQFSAPMSRGEAYRRVRLLNAQGEKIEFPFLELGEELWDRSGTRFTLFFDPGRIKRGLKPRELFGPALEEGKSYTLEIDRDWLDAQGDPLKEPVRKSFKVIEPDDVQPDHKKWRIAAPPAGTRRALTLRFDEPLDRAMLERVLVVRNAAGKAVAGAIRIDREETRWRFTPDDRWPAGRYFIEAETTLEDLAGNSLERPFEVDVFRSIDRKIETGTIQLPFEARPAEAR